MQEERKRILEMLQQGQVTVEQAAELLNALDASRQAEAGPGRAQRETDRTPPEGTNWAQFGRSLAQQVQQQISAAFGGVRRGGRTPRENYSTATLHPELLSRMEDDTSYTNYAHLIIADDVPEDLLKRKIGNLTNFGHVQGPAHLLALLQAKCSVNFGRFSETDQPSTTPPKPPRPPRPPKPPRPPRPLRARRPRAHEAEAVLTSYAMEAERQEIRIECHAGNLELAGTDGDTFRLLARKPLRSGETAPEGWENQFKWSADREGTRHTFTLGDPDDPEPTQDLTFRFEIPTEAEIAAHTAGGDIAASSLSGRLDLRTAGGDIAVGEIEGPVTAESKGGDIGVSEVEGDLTAQTGGGDIAISKIEGRADARTGGGDVSASEVEGELTIQTGGGDISVSRIEGPVKATTGGGNGAASEVEGDLTMETGGGNIAVSNISGSVTAKSGGGDVAISDVEGDVTIEAEGGSTALSNISGSVTAAGP